MQQRLHRSSLVPRGFVVESACYEGDKAVITVRASGSVGLCPSCGTVSRRIHSRYQRRVTDLPLSGRVVELLVIARRFRCDAVLCGRQIFTERFADGILAPSARRTARLDAIVHHLGGIGATAIDPKLLTAAERLQYEGYLRREETNAAISGPVEERYPHQADHAPDHGSWCGR